MTNIICSVYASEMISGLAPTYGTLYLLLLFVICVQDVCLVNVEYDIRGNLQRYIRSCQPLQKCTHLKTGACTEDGCCSPAPDNCLCRPGSELFSRPLIALYVCSMQFVIAVRDCCRYKYKYQSKYQAMVLDWLFNHQRVTWGNITTISLFVCHSAAP